MKLPVVCQRSNSEEGNQVFSSELTCTDPSPLVHHSFKPNGLYFLRAGQSSSFLSSATA